MVIFDSNSILNAGQTYELDMPFDFSEADLVAVRRREKSIFVGGCLKYVDAFRQKRVTLFSYKMSGHEKQSLGALSDTVGWTLNPTREGNEAT